MYQLYTQTRAKVKGFRVLCPVNQTQSLQTHWRQDEVLGMAVPQFLNLPNESAGPAVQLSVSEGPSKACCAPSHALIPQ